MPVKSGTVTEIGVIFKMHRVIRPGGWLISWQNYAQTNKGHCQ